MGNEGTKHDQGKPDLSLIPKASLEAQARVMMFGANKYGVYNYRQGFTYRRLLAAALRHITSFNDGEDLDPESGETHLAHAISCVSMLIDCIHLGTAKDDRYRRETHEVAKKSE